MRQDPPWRQRPGSTGQGSKQQNKNQWGRPQPEAPKTPAPPPRPMNIKADVIWALRGAGGGMSVYDVATKISQNYGTRYSEMKIQNVLELLAQDGKVEKSEATGRVTYRWAVEAI